MTNLIAKNTFDAVDITRLSHLSFYKLFNWLNENDMFERVMATVVEAPASIDNVGIESINSVLNEAGAQSLSSDVLRIIAGDEGNVSLAHAYAKGASAQSVRRNTRYQKTESVVGTQGVLSDLVERLRSAASGRKYYYRLSRNIDWPNQTYRYGSSCWFTIVGKRAGSRTGLGLNDGFALLIYERSNFPSTAGLSPNERSNIKARYNDLGRDYVVDGETVSLVPRGRVFISPCAKGYSIGMFNPYDKFNGLIKDDKARILLTPAMFLTIFLSVINGCGEWDSKLDGGVGKYDDSPLYLNPGAKPIIVAKGEELISNSSQKILMPRQTEHFKCPSCKKIMA